MLQESYLRWSAVDPDTIEHPRAYLARLVTRQAMNHLRAAKARREHYIGTWLPEPVRTEPDIGEDAVLAESVSMAVLLVLETLNQTERAVFVLHDVFGHTHAEIAETIGKTETATRQIAHRARSHAEIAETIGKTETATRQIAHRARSHVHARRRRFEPDSRATRQIAQRFLHAAATGDLQALLELMAPDIVQISDGGGKVSAARHPVTGRHAVAHYAMGVAQRKTTGAEAEFTSCNGLPAVQFRTRGRPDWLLAFEIHHDRITGLYAIRNPDKLHHTGTVHRLDRGGAAPWKP
ncbi:sigma factor-like helix-turn-helix DNA-binding protein [Saccharopolyspora hirsuta]|uniref:sigma factor-like helix-turn-helix DNA-binding protein n=1 Tax=Saccharopolyspora hirsuta TaxID=1837 RepID=UPI001BAE0CCA|nr:sigma factor-like helix-turn-helix DNA-binding protein [Saccharopolyspora hirsuta]